MADFNFRTAHNHCVNCGLSFNVTNTNRTHEVTYCPECGDKLNCEHGLPLVDSGECGECNKTYWRDQIEESGRPWTMRVQARKEFEHG